LSSASGEKHKTNILDLGEQKLTIDDLLEIINEERKKILETYGARNIDEFIWLIKTNRIDLYDALMIRIRLRILDMMEEAIYKELRFSKQ
jgi:hypothetical protein